MSKLVIVESPAKAKSISSYLGPGHIVLASYGHIRDLEPKASAIDPDKDFSMTWSISANSKKHIDNIVKAAKQSSIIYLATDPDREGEAIAWHIVSVLQEKKAIGSQPLLRATFHEVSKKSVVQAIESASKSLNQTLVDAYLARRCLDFLMGFHISPILWRKLPACRSAGRVQSVALRLICERTLEIERFTPQEYWSFEGNFEYGSDLSVTAQLSHINGKPLKQTVPSEEDAKKVASDIKSLTYAVSETAVKKSKINSAPPFITSTLQQAAYKKLGWATSKVMQVAQTLYEGVSINGAQTGLITYMRTDSTRIEADFTKKIRDFIAKEFGENYLPSTKVAHKNNTKNAQEAHEAIRPTDLALPPKATLPFLNEDQQKLYHLIWCRAIASQMAPAQKKTVSLIIEDAKKAFTFKATESSIEFQGHLALYQNENDAPSQTKSIPDIPNGTHTLLKELAPAQHFTKPPAYFNEASLIQALEENGIGRPSTYAPTIQTLFKRAYVEQNKKQLHPTLSGRVLVLFLKKYLEKYVQYDFTADMELQLDNIACEKQGWLATIQTFWNDLHANIKETSNVNPQDLSDEALTTLEHIILEPLGLNKDKSLCPKCSAKLTLKASRFGFFIGCLGYPDCDYILNLASQPSASDNSEPSTKSDPIEMGIHPDTNEPVLKKTGPYGPYLESGKKRVSLTPAVAKSLDWSLAKLLVSLPKVIGNHEEKDIALMTGRFGPYLKWGSTMCSVKVDKISDISETEAIELIKAKLAQPPKASRKRS